MQICDLKQEQFKRSINTGSNELNQHGQCYRCHQNTQEYKNIWFKAKFFKLEMIMQERRVRED